MSENMPKPSTFLLIYRADDTDSIQNFRVADFCCPADLFHLSPYPYFKSFDPFYICLDIVHVSAAYKATLHTRHLASLCLMGIICYHRNSINLINTVAYHLNCASSALT